MTLNDLENSVPEGVSTSSIGEVLHDFTPILFSITPSVLKCLKVQDLDINMLFILLALEQENYRILDQYDENNTRLDILKLQYQMLYIHGFIEDTDTNYQYQISEKGREFIDNITPLFNLGKVEEGVSINLKKLCIEYLELWPKMKFPSNQYARVNITEIEKKMNKFLKVQIPAFKNTYNIVLTEEDILKATKNYIDRYAKQGYMYAVTSSYFIQKLDKSLLADEILAMKQGLDSSINKFEKQI